MELQRQRKHPRLCAIDILRGHNGTGSIHEVAGAAGPDVLRDCYMWTARGGQALLIGSEASPVQHAVWCLSPVRNAERPVRAGKGFDGVTGAPTALFLQ